MLRARDRRLTQERLPLCSQEESMGGRKRFHSLAVATNQVW